MTVNRIIRSLSGVVLICALAVWWRLSVSHDPLDNVIEDFLLENDLPGAVVAVAMPGEDVDLRAYGLADFDTGRAMQVTDRFRFASLSKPLTATAILRAGSGTSDFTIDSPVSAVLPEFADAYDPRAAEITLRHLLQHSAGWDSARDLPPFFTSSEVLAGELGLDYDATTNCRPLADAMLKRGLQHDPGTQYAYSNLGYCWLGLWLEAYMNTPYQDAVARLVPEAAPLSLDAMDVTVMHRGLADSEPLLALDPLVIAAAGGWIGTAADFAAFATQEIDPLTLERPVYAPQGQFYGLGWRVWPGKDAHVLLTHYGSKPGVFSLVVRTLDGRAIVALFNGRPREDLPAFRSLFVGLAGLKQFSF